MWAEPSGSLTMNFFFAPAYNRLARVWEMLETAANDHNPGVTSNPPSKEDVPLHEIVIVGGGAAGLELATGLGNTLARRRRARITLVDKARAHLWKPLLHSVAAGSLDFDEHALDYLAQAHWHHFGYGFGEVIGLDRARKQIQLAATHESKGQWVGGPVPLGYHSTAKKLAVVPEDAALVRKIFADYLRLGSIGELAASLDREGIRPRPRKLANGRVIAAERFMVGPLAHLLKNRFYIGEIVYRGGIHRGEHPPILDRELFDAVQAGLAERAVARKLTRSRSPSILADLRRSRQSDEPEPCQQKGGIGIMCLRHSCRAARPMPDRSPGCRGVRCRGPRLQGS
jgi:recombinase/pyridine nucleotide-disulfide oxidoreductase